MNVSGTLIQRNQRVLAWCCFAAVAMLAILPGAVIAHVRTRLGGHSEHLLAYAVTALITALAYLDHSRFKIMFALFLYAGALEYLQRYAPGRSSSFKDFAYSATGIMLGVAAFQLIHHLRGRQAGNRSRFANGDMRSNPCCV